MATSGEHRDDGEGGTGGEARCDRRFRILRAAPRTRMQTRPADERGSCTLTRCARDTVRFALNEERSRKRGGRGGSVFLSFHALDHVGVAGGQRDRTIDRRGADAASRWSGQASSNRAEQADARAAYKTTDSLEYIERLVLAHEP